MAETLLYQGVAVNPANGLRFRLGFSSVTLTGPITLTNQDAQLQQLDPDAGGGRVVTLPAEESSQGTFFIIQNTGNTGDLTVNDDNGDGVDSVESDDSRWFVCDGLSWATM